MRRPKAEPRIDDRRYDEVLAVEARKVLQRLIDEQGSQPAAAKVLAVNQSTVSRALRPPGQPSARLLIALRAHYGVSIDEILGLRPVRFDKREAEVTGMLEKILTKLDTKLPMG